MMATFDLAVRTDGYPDFSFEQDLDGVIYQISCRWNERESQWYLTLADESGDAIAAGIKIVSNWVLAGRTVDARMPPGSIVTVDTSGSGIDPALTDLGNRVRLAYIEAET